MIEETSYHKTRFQLSAMISATRNFTTEIEKQEISELQLLLLSYLFHRWILSSHRTMNCSSGRHFYQPGSCKHNPASRLAGADFHSSWCILLGCCLSRKISLQRESHWDQSKSLFASPEASSPRTPAHIYILNRKTCLNNFGAKSARYYW